MYDQIRITANRRCEVGVAGGRQCEVSLVPIAVAGLLQGPQHQVGENALLRLAFNPGNQLLIITRRDDHAFLGHNDVLANGASVASAFFDLTGRPLPDGRGSDLMCADAERVAEAGGDLLEIHHTLSLGLLVNSEQRGNAGLLQMRCHSLICGQHEFFDNPMRDVPVAPSDTGHLAKLIKLDQRLGHIEINRTALDSLPVQDQGKFAHGLETPY